MIEIILRIMQNRGCKLVAWARSIALRKEIIPSENQIEEISWKLISGYNIAEEFDYKDETWNEIRFIHARGLLDWMGMKRVIFENNPCANQRVTFQKNALRVLSEEPIGNRWIFLRYLKPVGPVHAIEYDVSLASEFTELQFAFSYCSIMDRNRFMIVNNRELIFQVIENGLFIPPLISKPLQLEKKKSYHTRIEVINDRFFYYLDGHVQISLRLPSRRTNPDDGIVLIFFETSPQRKIDVRIDNLRIYRSA